MECAMSAGNSSVDYILEQAAGAGNVRGRAMFGGYALYCDDKVVALFGDDTIFLKPTEAGRRLLPEAREAPPYPGAKPCLVVSEDIWDDAEQLARLFSETAKALPAPKPKKPRQTKPKSRRQGA